MSAFESCARCISLYLPGVWLPLLVILLPLSAALSGLHALEAELQALDRS